jgi:hypothetical protein
MLKRHALCGKNLSSYVPTGQRYDGEGERQASDASDSLETATGRAEEAAIMSYRCVLFLTFGRCARVGTWERLPYKTDCVKLSLVEVIGCW